MVGYHEAAKCQAIKKVHSIHSSIYIFMCNNVPESKLALNLAVRSVELIKGFVEIRVDADAVTLILHRNIIGRYMILYRYLMMHISQLSAV